MKLLESLFSVYRLCNARCMHAEPLSRFFLFIRQEKKKERLSAAPSYLTGLQQTPLLSPLPLSPSLTSYRITSK